MFSLNYNKDEKLEFNYKRACGLWLIVVAVVIALATLIGGKQIINMQVFCIGYVISFFSKIAISICTLFVLPAKISELDLKYMSRLGLAYSF